MTDLITTLTVAVALALLLDCWREVRTIKVKKPLNRVTRGIYKYYE